MEQLIFIAYWWTLLVSAGLYIYGRMAHDFTVQEGLCVVIPFFFIKLVAASMLFMVWLT